MDQNPFKKWIKQLAAVFVILWKRCQCAWGQNTKFQKKPGWHKFSKGKL